MNDPIRPNLINATYGDILDNFRETVKLTPTEIDEIIVNHNFTRESLEETYRLFKILWNYQASAPLNKP